MMKLTHVAQWQPQDPVEYHEYEDEDGVSHFDPVYSKRDQEAYDRALALDLEELHRDHMREYARQFDSARAHFERLLETMRREVLEARSNSRWSYVKADEGKLAEQDEMMIQRVTMTANGFYATHAIDRLTRMSMDQAQFQELKDFATDNLRYMLTKTVYGHEHEEIVTRRKHEVVFEVPDGWWQTFKRDRLRKPCRMREEKVTVELAVSAKPFSAFPELPYAADPKWGPRIDLLLPRGISVREFRGGA